MKNNQFSQVLPLLPSIDVNIRDEQDNYLIQYAILFNSLEVVEKLISLGCKLDIIDREGHSITYLPIKYSRLHILQKLLSYEQKVIGIHLPDLQDDNGHIPLHYSIMFNNKEAFDMLLPKTNVNIRNNLENNALHLSIQYTHYHFVSPLLQSKISISHKNKSGLSPFHLVCLNNDNDTITQFIEASKTLDVKDERDKTPLMYLIENQNIEMIKLLLQKDSMTSTQDVYGNSVLHYAILTENPEIVNLVVPYVKEFNLVNIDSMTPLHLLLSRIENITRYPIDVLLRNTNLNIQDKDGNTVLHLLVQDEKWIHLMEVLVGLKLNTHLKNNHHKTALDLVSNKKEFISLVTLSYYNTLQNKDRIWMEKWENQCNALRERKPTNKEECLKIIKSHLDKKSIPYYQDRFCVNVEEPDNVTMTTFTGITLDIVAGCLLLKTSSLLSKEFVHHKEIERYYHSLGYIKNDKTEFYNFEVMWIYNRLFVPTNFKQSVDRFKKGKDRFLIMPFGIELSHGAHANILIYDRQENTLERFEPNGSYPPYGFFYPASKIDTQIEQITKEYFKDMKYITPQQFLPKIGFQNLEESDTHKKIGDPGGFCVAWCLWYATQRLKEPNIPPPKLIHKLIFDIRAKNIKFINLIRSFAEKITHERKKLLGNIDINDWINNTVTTQDIQNVINRIISSIE